MPLRTGLRARHVHKGRTMGVERTTALYPPRPPPPRVSAFADNFTATERSYFDSAEMRSFADHPERLFVGDALFGGPGRAAPLRRPPGAAARSLPQDYPEGMTAMPRLSASPTERQRIQELQREAENRRLITDTVSLRKQRSTGIPNGALLAGREDDRPESRPLVRHAPDNPLIVRTEPTLAPTSVTATVLPTAVAPPTDRGVWQPARTESPISAPASVTTARIAGATPVGREPEGPLRPAVPVPTVSERSAEDRSAYADRHGPSSVVVQRLNGGRPGMGIHTEEPDTGGADRAPDRLPTRFDRGYPVAAPSGRASTEGYAPRTAGSSTARRNAFASRMLTAHADDDRGPAGPSGPGTTVPGISARRITGGGQSGASLPAPIGTVGGDGRFATAAVSAPSVPSIAGVLDVQGWLAAERVPEYYEPVAGRSGRSHAAGDTWVEAASRTGAAEPRGTKRNRAHMEHGNRTVTDAHDPRDAVPDALRHILRLPFVAADPVPFPGGVRRPDAGSFATMVPSREAVRTAAHDVPPGRGGGGDAGPAAQRTVRRAQSERTEPPVLPAEAVRNRTDAAPPAAEPKRVSFQVPTAAVSADQTLDRMRGPRVPGLKHTQRSRNGWNRNNPFGARSEQMSAHWSTNAHLLGTGR